MSRWVAPVRTALSAEFGAKPWIGALATVDASMRPRVRSVVCRKVEDDGCLWITCDSRSEKVRQIAEHPHGEIVFWLPSRREQFRVAGSLDRVEVGDPRRTLAWRDLSDATRRTFFWPSDLIPGDPAIPASFAVLVLIPDRAEHLDLNPEPHRRVCWEADRGWLPERIEP